MYVNQLQQIHQYYQTTSKQKKRFCFLLNILKINKLTLTRRFLKFLLNSPLALTSNKLIRRVFISILICSFFRKAKLDRRLFNGGKSIIDDRRPDERDSGCLKEPKLSTINFQIKKKQIYSY